MPRPKTISDADVLDVTLDLIAERGIAELTLASVASEVGLSPATLLQRFGSKRGLLTGAAAHAAAGAATPLVEAGERAASPLGALIDGLVALAEPVATPESMGHALAFLQLDLSDPDFGAHARTHARAVEREIRRQLDRAVAAGELDEATDTARLAGAVRALYNGTLIGWALDGEGRLDARLRDALELVLGALRASVR